MHLAADKSVLDANAHQHTNQNAFIRLNKVTGYSLRRRNIEEGMIFGRGSFSDKCSYNSHSRNLRTVFIPEVDS